MHSNRHVVLQLMREYFSSFPPIFPSLSLPSLFSFPLPPSLSPSSVFLLEYLELDRQLDQLDAALTVLEGRREQLHREAKQLLVDAKAAREQNIEEEDSKEDSCHQEDQTQNGSAEK